MMIETIWSVIGEKKLTVCFTVPYRCRMIRSWMKVVQEKSYSKADLSKQKWKDLVSFSQHSHFGTCLFKEGWSGGCWQWKFSLSQHLQCDSEQSLFWLLSHEQHQKQSFLAGASTCFWSQGTQYLQQLSHIQCSVSVGMWYWQKKIYIFLYIYISFLPVQGKHLPVKTVICRSNRGSANNCRFQSAIQLLSWL